MVQSYMMLDAYDAWFFIFERYLRQWILGNLWQQILTKICKICLKFNAGSFGVYLIGCNHCKHVVALRMGVCGDKSVRVIDQKLICFDIVVSCAFFCRWMCCYYAIIGVIINFKYKCVQEYRRMNCDSWGDSIRMISMISTCAILICIYVAFFLKVMFCFFLRHTGSSSFQVNIL